MEDKYEVTDQELIDTINQADEARAATRKIVKELMNQGLSLEEAQGLLEFTEERENV